MWEAYVTESSFFTSYIWCCSGLFQCRRVGGVHSRKHFFYLLWTGTTTVLSATSQNVSIECTGWVITEQIKQKVEMSALWKYSLNTWHESVWFAVNKDKNRSCSADWRSECPLPPPPHHHHHQKGGVFLLLTWKMWVNVISLSLIHIWRCRRLLRCRSRWSPYH